MAKAKINEESKTLYLARALYDAVEDCNIQQVDTLLSQNKANPNILIPDERMTPFHLAAGHENMAFGKVVATLFLHNGGDPNVRCEGGRTVLHIAVAWNRSSVVEILLKSPYMVPDPYLKDDDDLNVFNYAVKFNAWESLATLHSHVKYLKHTSDSKNQVCRILQPNYSRKDDSILAEDLKSEKSIGFTSTFNESNRLHTSSGYFNSGESLNNTSKMTKYESVNQTNTSEKSTSEIVLSSTNNSISDILNKNVMSSDYHHTNLLDDILVDNFSDRFMSNNFEEVENISFPSENLIVDSNIFKFNEVDSITENNVNIPKNNCEWMTDISGLSSRLESDDYFTCPDSYLEKRSHNKKNIKTNISLEKITNNITMTSFEDSIRSISKISIGTDSEKVSNHYIDSDESSSLTELTDDYDTDDIRQSLRKYGYPPGPLVSSTKRIYARKLSRIMKNKPELKQDDLATNILLANGSYSSQLTKVLSTDKFDTWKITINSWSTLEEEIICRKSGSSFTYLLLDPRITKNLPSRADQMNDPILVWQTFINSIFYIGKGTKSRPNDHMNEAFNCWIGQNKEMSQKTEYILDLWRAKLGVVCVQAFHHLVLKEAHIREAAMIDAIGLEKLTNEKRGTYYENTLRWRLSDRCKLGCYLLYRAMLIFLADGERQLQPIDLT